MAGQIGITSKSSSKTQNKSTQTTGLKLPESRLQGEYFNSVTCIH